MLGSINFVAAARSVLVVGYDPEDETGDRRILAHAKSSLARAGESLMFELSAEKGFLWAGTSPLSAEEIFAAPRSSEEVSASSGPSRVRANDVESGNGS